MVWQWNSTSEYLDFIQDVIDYCQIICRYCYYYGLLFSLFLNFVLNWKLGGEIEWSLGEQLNFLHIKTVQGWSSHLWNVLWIWKTRKLMEAAIAFCFETIARSQIEHKLKKAGDQRLFYWIFDNLSLWSIYRERQLIFRRGIWIGMVLRSLDEGHKQDIGYSWGIQRKYYYAHHGTSILQISICLMFRLQKGNRSTEWLDCLR